ncbi:general odorant-binding protein 99b-like [Topomyia yanbarensis]|uniref:general odorant-binding protein 99b-like n=1 Tax=Topomyia yanbarensis TaxID=2498891 RepID=UPI00273B8F8E|nr:general odorant-binding protein 99b-like [Topomyia yanbarensis]
MKFSVALLLFVGLALHYSDGALYTAEDYQKFIKTCGKILRTSSETYQRYKDKDFSENSELYCLIRCVGIRTGFYDDETGTNWERVEEHHSGKPGLSEYKKATQECTAALKPEDYADDYCKKSFQHFDCARKAYDVHLKA